ncbi:branched-chain amino acid ABC transporter permease [Egibacter rhizosphaerae]|uniref:Branched-chain amino acid ABC transporter permease n=1 Tax=Egibacter rhizosphaerae TaxID=1670831 RepID=A0A411YEY7_9ACTN|nr:branched-chain amino acid ABC transporter permease [Egibacter rhizosphaerae]QBI19785.1 branched-chain amino acid ABC transporter permease [Egibacter rhizosphaerae]
MSSETTSTSPPSDHPDPAAGTGPGRVRQGGMLIGGLVVIAVLLVFPHLLPSGYWVDLAIQVLIWGALASAWNIAAGYAGGLSLGHAAFLGVGAYTSTLLFLEFDISPWLGLFAGAGLAALLGLVLGAITFRLRGPFFVLATLAFGFVVHILAVNLREITRGAAGLVVPFDGGWENMLFASLEAYWYLGLGLVGLVVGVTLWLERVRFGYYLVAIREDEDAARSVGVRVVRWKLVAAALSAALTAVAGTVYAQFVQYIDPDSTTQFELSVQIALVAIVGGMGTAWGPMLGAVIVIPLGEILRAQLGGGPSLMVYGLLLVVIVVLAPRGALPWLQATGRRLARRRGAR